MYRIPFIFLITILISGWGYGKNVPWQNKSIPNRIVALSPAITESLYSLGAEKKIIANTSYCNYPEEAKTKKKIGTMQTPNIEKILSLMPDMIIGSSINPHHTIEKLKALNLKVEIFSGDVQFEAICKNFLHLGRLVDKEVMAKEIILKVTQEVNSIKKKISAHHKPSVFWQVGKNPLVTVSKGTFADELIAFAGGRNITHNLKAKYPRINLEQVIQQDPEIIIIVSMGEIAEDAVNMWMQYKTIKAVKNNRVYIIDADSVCRPTPLRFLEGFKKVGACIHPEINCIGETK